MVNYNNPFRCWICLISLNLLNFKPYLADFQGTKIVICSRCVEALIQADIDFTIKPITYKEYLNLPRLLNYIDQSEETKWIGLSPKQRKSRLY